MVEKFKILKTLLKCGKVYEEVNTVSSSFWKDPSGNWQRWIQGEEKAIQVL